MSSDTAAQRQWHEDACKHPNGGRLGPGLFLTQAGHREWASARDHSYTTAAHRGADCQICCHSQERSCDTSFGLLCRRRARDGRGMGAQIGRPSSAAPRACHRRCRRQESLLASSAASVAPRRGNERAWLSSSRMCVLQASARPSARCKQE
jgi:hypothetical protein